MLTPDQAAYTQKYQAGHTRVQALDAIGNRAKKTLCDAIADILVAARRHGIEDMTVGEIADQYRLNTGKYKPPSSFSQPIKDLKLSKRIEATKERIYAGSGRLQEAYRIVAQQTRLVG
jgi:hypothetical protein